MKFRIAAAMVNHVPDVVVTTDMHASCTHRYYEESIRMTEDGDKWRKYVYGVANPRIKDG